MRSPAFLAAVILLCSAPLAANGRFPASRDIEVSGDGDTWLVPVTFGLLVSHDGGATVRWVCEDAMGYSGTYDPTFVIAPGGSLWMTSFDGVRVSRDGGCTWTPVGAPFDELFPGALALDGSGRLWAVTAETGTENGAYRNADPSTNSFTELGLSSEDGLFTSIEVAPSLPSRALVAGFAIPESGVPEPLLHRTDDDGANWQPLPTDDFVLGTQPQLAVVGVAPDDPDFVLVHVGRNASSGGDTLYRSQDGGLSFEEILSITGNIESVLIRAGGTIVVGAGTQGLRISTDGGDSFAVSQSTPLLTCITERSDGSLLGCGSNVAPDLFALGSSESGQTWSPELVFADIAGPLQCPEDTVQRDTCVALWPGLAEQIGAGEMPGGLDAGPDEEERPPPTDGCGCGFGGLRPGTVLAVLLLVLAIALRPRRVR